MCRHSGVIVTDLALDLAVKRCTLQGFSDADWVGFYETQRSTTSFMFILGGAAVSWASKL